jgi:signal transduction histidine kinase
LRQLEGFLRDAARSLSLLIRVRDEAERERLAALGEMAAGLAHEIRNPLGAIQGAVQLLPQSQDSGPWTQVIREEVAKMNHVVAQFLDYSRRPSYQKVSLDVSSWLIHAVDRLNQGLLRSGLSEHAAVHLEVVSTNLRIELEPDAFFQVFENLVRNSMQARATRIFLRADDVENRSRFLLEYRDNRIGFSEQAFDKLFAPFFTTRTAGTGLGLSICRRIVEGHGGQIEAMRSTEGGASFKMILPLSDSQKGTQKS